MTESMFHDGHRTLQDRFDGRRVADALERHRRLAAFGPEHVALIEGAAFFFLATAHGDSVDCSFKGGPPGFVRVTGPSELAFPDYDGNGMFKSLGNVVANANVGLLFIAMHGQPKRLRVNGAATVSYDDPLLEQAVGAQMIVRVQVRAIFPNCPRYIPTLELAEPSIYAPRAGVDAPEPAWKSFDLFKDVVPPRAPTFKG